MAENLYCPRCGNKFALETQYCRKCGLALDGVSQIVNGDAENKPVVTRRPNFKLFQIGIALFIFGMVIGLINGALRDFELFSQSYGKLIFMLFVAAGMLTLGAGFLFPTKKYAKPNRKPSGADVPDRLDTSELSNDLLPSGHPEGDITFPKDQRETVPAGPHSVTEHTTRNLS